MSGKWFVRESVFVFCRGDFNNGGIRIVAPPVQISCLQKDIVSWCLPLDSNVVTILSLSSRIHFYVNSENTFVKCLLVTLLH